MTAFAAAIARAITRATTRKDATEETGAATEMAYPPPRTEGLRSESSVREYDTIKALGQVWAVGLMWSDGDLEREVGLQRARVRVADAKRREVREGKANLIIVRPIAVGETEHFYEQYGLALEVIGRVERGTRSLGAHIASQWNTGSVAGLFRVEPEAAYLIVVQEGVIRPGTDRCYASYADAMNELLQLVKMMGGGEWKVVLSPEDEETSIPALAERAVTVEHRELADLLSSDDSVPVLGTIRFQMPRRVKRIGAVALVVALPPTLWWGFDLDRLRYFRETYVPEVSAPAKQVVTAKDEYLVPAPWEESIHEPGEWLVRCVSGIEQVPMIAAPPRYVAGESAFREVVSVACDGRRMRVLRDSLIATDSDFGRKSSEEIALGGEEGTPNNGAAWGGFTPVALDSLQGIEIDSDESERAVAEDARNMLMEVVDGVGTATMYLIGGEVHPGAVDTGLLKNTRELGWATLGFQITAGNIALTEARRWREALARAKALQLTDVLWSPGSGWVLSGFVAGTTMPAAEAGAALPRMSASELSSGPFK